MPGLLDCLMPACRQARAVTPPAVAGLILAAVIALAVTAIGWCTRWDQAPGVGASRRQVPLVAPSRRCRVRQGIWRPPSVAGLAHRLLQRPAWPRRARG